MERRLHITCYVCQEVQRDRWAYRNHLLRVHGQVIRGGTSTPVRLEGQELEDTWWVDRAHMCDASNRREVMGLPPVTIEEADRRRHDNRERRERRGRAVARARNFMQNRATRQRAARHCNTPPRRRHSRVASPSSTTATQTDTVPTLLAGQHHVSLHFPTAPAPTLCGQCIHCPCQQGNLSRAQTVYPPLRATPVHTATQVDSRPHLWTTASQTTSSAPSQQDASTQILIRPNRREADTQTGRAGSFHRAAQTEHLALSNSWTSMTPVLVTTTGCQAGAVFDNDLIPPGVPRPLMPWGYSYRQFQTLLSSYPTIHPEDFISFGVSRSQPRTGSRGEWGEVAGVLEHMVGGRRLLADDFYTVMRRIQLLPRTDPARAAEEDVLIDLVLAERGRARAPIGEGAYATLGAPGGPLALATAHRPHRRPQPSSSVPPPHRSTSPRLRAPRGRGRRPYRATPGPSAAQGGPRRPPPGFVDLTTEEDMDVTEEDHYLGPRDHNAGPDSPEDGSTTL